LGVLGFVLFRWIPATGKGLLLFLALFAIFIVLIVLLILLMPKRRGYWPTRPDDR